jgi:chromosome segregation ATPase
LDDEATQLKVNLEKSGLEGEASEKLKLKLVELESSVELLDHELLKASEEITRLNTQVNSLTETLDAKEEEREKEIEVWRTRCTNLAETLDDVQEKFEDLANQKEELDTIATDAQSTVDRERKLNESLSLQIKELESEISILTEKLTTSLDEQHLVIDELETKLNEQNGLLEAKDELVSQLETDLDGLRKEFNDAKSDLNMENDKLLGKYCSNHEFISLNM